MSAAGQNQILEGLLRSWDPAQRLHGEELLEMVDEQGLGDFLRGCLHRARLYRWLKRCGEGEVTDPPPMPEFRLLGHPQFLWGKDPLTRGASPLGQHPTRGWFYYQEGGVGHASTPSSTGT